MLEVVTGEGIVVDELPRGRYDIDPVRSRAHLSGPRPIRSGHLLLHEPLERSSLLVVLDDGSGTIECTGPERAGAGWTMTARLSPAGRVASPRVSTLRVSTLRGVRGALYLDAHGTAGDDGPGLSLVLVARVRGPHHEEKT